MSTASLAQRELQAVLGYEVLHDRVWHDLHTFVTTALDCADAVWNLRQLEESDLQQIAYKRTTIEEKAYEQRCTSVAEQVCGVLGRDRAANGAASIVLYPHYWQPTYNNSRRGYYYRETLPSIVNDVALHCIAMVQPADWLHRLARRLYDLCMTTQVGNNPHFGMCIEYLLSDDRSLTDEHAAALLDALTVGAWNAAWQHICALAERPVGRNTDLLRDHWQRVLAPSVQTATRQPTPVERVQELWQAQGSRYVPLLLARLDLRDHPDQHLLERLWNRITNQPESDPDGRQLNMATFRRVLEAVPASLSTINDFIGRSRTWYDGPAKSSPWAERVCQPEFIARLKHLVGSVLWELVSDFRAESWPTLMSVQTLPGGRYLLRLAEEVQQRGITRLNNSYGYWHTNISAETVLAVLLDRVRRDNDDSAALVPLLKQFDVATLLAILPLVHPFEADICAALDWDGSLALIELLRQIEKHDLGNSTDPTAGVVQHQAVRDLVEQLGEERMRLLLGAFSFHRSSSVMLVQAVLGWNRTEVRRLFGRRRPLAARALALLPFEKNDTVLKRYQTLINFEREANTSPAGKKAAERAAAQAGLHILALQAGYTDTTRFEWAMQDQLGEQGVSIHRQWEIEHYTLTMRLRETTPVIEVHNGKRLLKRTPSAVTRDYLYRDVRATFDQLKDQHRRYLQAFTNAMRRGEPLTLAELALLRRNPLATALLERLVLRTPDGAFGLYRAEDDSLEGYREERVKIDDLAYIAHPYDLAQAGVLGDWQAEIVRRQMVQPFKQVFRELYVLTPAEVEAGYSSARLASRQMKGRQATAILANMGWHVGGYSSVTKPFYDLGFAAHFETGAYWDYDDSGEHQATTGALSFQPLHGKDALFPRREPHERRIHLSEIPPLVLSEVLRDIDLVTVAAHGSDDDGSSREVLQRRGDLVRATVTALGLRNVEVEERHVRVQGTLAHYRIHLATAAIYIEPGSYLCIVPAAKTRSATYLPFEEGGDAVSSELISKVLLLANDTTISDPTILAQITPMRRAA